MIGQYILNHMPHSQSKHPMYNKTGPLVKLLGEARVCQSTQTHPHHRSALLLPHAVGALSAIVQKLVVVVVALPFFFGPFVFPSRPFSPRRLRRCCPTAVTFRRSSSCQPSYHLNCNPLFSFITVWNLALHRSVFRYVAAVRVRVRARVITPTSRAQKPPPPPQAHHGRHSHRPPSTTTKTLTTTLLATLIFAL